MNFVWVVQLSFLVLSMLALVKTVVGHRAAPISSLVLAIIVVNGSVAGTIAGLAARTAEGEATSSAVTTGQQ